MPGVDQKDGIHTCYEGCECQKGVGWAVIEIIHLTLDEIAESIFYNRIPMANKRFDL